MRRFQILVLCATLAGAFLRLWQLTRVPPGLHYDLAATALLGNEVAFNGFRPIFITAYTGHEALYYYWLALWFWLVGSSVFTLRLAAALLGVLAIPAAWFALRQVWRAEKNAALLAALGAGGLAFAFFHVTFSRFGFRVITEPVVQALALGFTIRGAWRLEKHKNKRHADQDLKSAQPASQQAWLDLALGGFFTGLAAYTYLAARLFPFPLAVFWGVLLWGEWRSKVRSLTPNAQRPKPLGSSLQSPITNNQLPITQFLLFTLAAALTFAPLAYYFWQHPADFLNRAGQVVPKAGETELLLTGIRRAFEMVFINGEPYDRFNIPGRPLLGSVLGALFVIGWLVTLRNVFRKQTPLALAREALLIVWVPFMLVPTALSVHDIFPSNVRAFGLIPLLFVFPARGLVTAYRAVQRFMPGPIIPRAHPVTLLGFAMVAVGTWATYNDYFNIWANLPTQALNNDADLTAIAAFTNARDLSGAATYVTTIHYRHPTLAYLARDFGQFHWLTGGHTLVIPAGQPALYLVASSAPLPAEWIADWGAHQLPTDPLFQAFAFGADDTPPLPRLAPLNLNFGNLVTVLGYQPVSTDQIDLQFRVENLPEAGDLQPYVRLDDAWGDTWAQSMPFAYPAEQWQPGDVVRARFTFDLPPGLPPGTYTVRVGFYANSVALNVPHLAADGAYAGERATVGALTVTTGGAGEWDENILKPERPLTAEGPLRLRGYALNTRAPRQNERVWLTLYWQAESAPTVPTYTLTLGERVLYRGAAVRDTYPLTQLPPGQRLADRLPLVIPPDFPGDPAELTLTLPGAGTIGLTTLTVQPVARAFAPPEGAWAPRADDFGGLIRLAGYRWAGGQLTVLWQALAPIPADYVIFTHLRDANGQLLAQRDAAPSAYPTTTWLTGEYLTDAFTFEAPIPADATLDLGLYLPETGARLQVGDDDKVVLGMK
jgi:hypothetical protein